MSTPSRRGMQLSGYQTAIQLAALAGFWAAFASHSGLPDSSQLQWKIPVAVQLLPGILLLLGTTAIPESPKYLVEKGYLEAAEDALAWLRGVPTGHCDVADEFAELLDDSEAMGVLQARGSSFLRALREKSIRKRLGVGIGLMIAQNMVGLNALNYCKNFSLIFFFENYYSTPPH
jgi:MFS family permease